MSTELNPSQTTKPANGGVEEDTQPPNSQQRKYEYKLEDFSQSAINRGQQYINYELVEVNKRIVTALESLKDVIAGGPGGPAINLASVVAAINEVYKANEKVAGWYPPGCRSGGNAGAPGDDPPPPPPQETS